MVPASPSSISRVTILQHSRLAGALALLAVCSACIPLPGGYSLESKVVSAKEGSNTLVATDGTRCSVSDSAYEDARVGREHRCAWSGRSGVGGAARPLISD